MPGQFITSFLDTHFDKFKDLVTKAQPTDFCSLRKFGNGEEWDPDYTNPLHREFYYLKYSSAYMTEYYLAFKNIFEKNWFIPDNRIVTLSIGCGAMFDLVGFEYARRNTEQFVATPYTYYGIDLVDWNCNETKTIPGITLFERGIDNFNHNDCDYKYDIIIFPKSISDIPKESLFKFAHSITDKTISNKLCIINSKRGNSHTDTEYAEKFCNIIKDNLGYTIIRETFTLSENEDETRFESLLDNQFIFDNNIGQFLKQFGQKRLLCKCPDSDQLHCSEVLGKWPMRFAQNIEPEIYYLEKN